MNRLVKRYIYIARNENGKWRLWAEMGQEAWTEENFSTLRQACRFVPQYAKMLGWEPDSYTTSVTQ